ncbi:mannosyl-oligosaccharide 1,2-alpha-mannosidase [Gracilaria domingensis]|nr:mannosyl-oligosaccharide 1,2-alpha-mannosidase [Gracilaria domingensis]
MRVLAKPAKHTLRFTLLRILYLLLTRTTVFAIFVSLGFALFLTSLGTSPPPAALEQASREHALGDEDSHKCGCTRIDTCLTAVPVGSFIPPVLDTGSEHLNEQRLLILRQAALSSWQEYERHAWGSDFLRPRSEKGSDVFGLGATIIEAIPTLYIMGLMEPYERAREWVDRHFNVEISEFLNVHEVTTRILGALLSSYQIAGDPIFLDKAEILAARLAPAFDTLNGVPYPLCRLAGFRNGTFDAANVCKGTQTSQSAAAGISLEFRALAFHTLRPELRQLRCKADRAVQAVVEAGPRLLREHISDEIEGRSVNFDVDDDEEDEESTVYQNSRFRTIHSYYAYMVELWQSAVIAIGAGPAIDTTATFTGHARGFYEYLTKAWRQGGGCEATYRFPLDASMHMLLKRSIQEASTGDLYLRALDTASETNDAVVEQSMCYLPAVFHIAAQHKEISERREEQWRDVAESITKSCIRMYEQFPGGLGGDSARYNGKVWITKGAYRLQADLVEALFYMWRSTSDEYYRETAWRIFLNITKECGLNNGAFTVLEEYTIGNITKGDLMPSEFIGSTLRFLFLTFTNTETLPLDQWVFNRAGHALVVTPGLGAINNCATELIR